MESIEIETAMRGDWRLANAMELEKRRPEPYMPPAYAGFPGFCSGGFCDIDVEVDEENEITPVFSPPTIDPPRRDVKGVINVANIGRLIGYEYPHSCGELRTDLLGEVTHIDDTPLAEYAKSIGFTPRACFL